MKLGCFQSNRGLREMTYADFVSHASALGYEAFDVPLNNADAPDLVAAHDAIIHATSAIIPPDLSTDEAQQEEIISVVTDAVDRAADAGIGVVTHLVGKDTSVNGDENITLFKAVYTPIAAHAESRNVKLAFENWPRNNTMLAITPELWHAMFNAVPSPALGLCYDPSHLYWMGIDWEQPMRDFADRVYHAHAKDTELIASGQAQFGIYGRQLEATEPGEWWRYRLPGYGEIDMVKYVDLLYQIGYDAVLSVEHEDPIWSNTPAQALRGLKLAKQILMPLFA